MIIVTCGRPRYLRAALESILLSTPGPFEIIVVDADKAGSGASVVRELEESSDIRLRYETCSPSLAVQRNHGVALSSGEVVVFLDDDVCVHPGLFAALARAYADPAIVGATGRVIEPRARPVGGPGSPLRRYLFPFGADGTMTKFGYPRRITVPELERDVEWMQGCFMSARRAHALEVGHDERITAEFEGEDEDFSYRLSRLGRIRYLPDAIVTHHQLGFRRRRGPDFDRRIVLARAYLFRKNFPQGRVRRAQFAGLLALLFAHRLVNREWDGLRGLLAGVRQARRRRFEDLLSG